ncbi:MAG: hypothetical protein KDC49_14430 [Saprospiraceae bacterium]|nr:hypothetical protein [Saprospiraceae bacterium]
MVKIYRNIRQKLLSESKTGKYIKYAVGEIVLVVIGILIALQVNNWNEGRKSKLQQTVFLKNIRQDLMNDLVQLDKIIDYQTKKLQVVTALSEELTHEKDFNKIENLFTTIQNTTNATFFANTGAYTTSGTSGVLDNLQPDSLKIAITTLYERYYKRLIYNGEIYDNRTDEVVILRGKYFNKLTGTLTNKEVINDSEFINLTSIALYNNGNYVSLSNSTKKEIEKVVSLVDENLKD